ncbi:hypothetical protein RB195_015917 [Necator americanus]|uniref:Uncharacterized protein n=1 Tax=Necator americanus TaxID=51031 RepID=A0ABR1E6W4_NECAM
MAVRFIAIQYLRSSAVMFPLVTLLAIVPLVVHTLKCYEGIDGEQLSEVEKEETADEKYMCMYEPRNPCYFDVPDEYNIYNYDPWYAEHCWTLERAVCFCTEDLCNTNYDKLLEYWEATPNENTTLLHCVRKHLRNKILLTKPNESTEPNGNGGSTTGSPGSATGSPGSGTSPGSGSSESGSSENGSGSSKPAPEGVESSSSDSGTQRTGTGVSTTGTNEDGGGSKATSTDTSTEKRKNTGDRSIKGSENENHFNGKKGDDDYDWTLFIILAIIAAILIFIVIPILLLMIIRKNSKAKKSSRKSASSKRFSEESDKSK